MCRAELLRDPRAAGAGVGRPPRLPRRFFEGREPGEAHRRLAALAGRGLIRVFVTTNFDRLLEHALQEVGLEPVVVTSDADLSCAPAREHVPYYVLNSHGDYLQQTMRNTAAELAALEPGVTGELRSIIDRSGLVVIGYSGSDEAIAEAQSAPAPRATASIGSVAAS